MRLLSVSGLLLTLDISKVLHDRGRRGYPAARIPMTRAAGMTAPAWTIYRDAGLTNRSGLTVLRSTAPFRKADLRSCMFRSDSGSIGGASVCPVAVASFWSARGGGIDVAARSL